jgi:uncharacterized protein YdhG (YjbR/CyaY superfamily)
MRKPAIDSVERYIAAQPENTRAVLSRVRQILRRALPQAEETISYGMPAYRVHGRIAIYLAGWKQHYSLYPAIGGLQEEFREELARYQTSKGTIRFPLDEPPPARLIARIAKFRANAVAERAAVKSRGGTKA